MSLQLWIDGTCVYVEIIPGCMNPFACNYNLNANEPDGSCEACIYGCNDPNAINYDDSVDSLLEGSCVYPVFGCLNPLYIEYNSLANIDSDPSDCINLSIAGCTDPTSANYSNVANVDDGPCVASIPGCTIEGMPCFDSNANTLDASTCFSCIGLRSFRTFN